MSKLVGGYEYWVQCPECGVHTEGYRNMNDDGTIKCIGNPFYGEHHGCGVLLEVDVIVVKNQ